MEIKRRLAVLGSTGSIGTQALDVAARHAERFEVVALTAHGNREKLFEQVRAFRPAFAALTDGRFTMADVPEDLRFCRWSFGRAALLEAAALSEAQDVLVAVVGMAGLESVLAALAQKKRVLLANKEALVAGGQLVTDAAARAGEHTLLPVDSEHSAVFQCLQGAGSNPMETLYLTCSGGPFRTLGKAEIDRATREQALRHPTWTMGQKITVDCATLFNKALEVIEARYLFHVEPSQIQVLIHPQSVVHSAVGFADGAVLAQLGTPDMRLPILYAMAYPDRLPTGGPKLDFFTLKELTFERPDPVRFPSLRLAYECLAAGGAACCMLNAANEEAVGAFLRDHGPSPVTVGRIYAVVEETLQRVGNLPAGTLGQVLEADRRAREVARALLT
ncbi:MAG TPA: 1-deoxy-D-xylulose-5-phosphate reductoisomerase [Candidatus Limiplasma sp.]|nr:1-deoxy-D-xylulose-5-phosphate reductoisomerase [Candidatus Limiplasma sp.]HPS81083.1 1-deoxy-D-xylulose-5-phosphate reductoisomerase [Candidatus Limiplasma sp.]